MKKLTSLSALFIFALLIAACGSNPQKAGPSPTAEAFLSALQAGDYEEAKEYCSPESRDKLDMMASLSSLGANPNAKDFKIEREELSGDYARVYYTQEDSREKMLKLRNTTGKWEVIASKTDLSAEEEEASPVDEFGDEFAEGMEEGLEQFSASLDSSMEKISESFEGIGNGSDGEEESEDTGLKYMEVRKGKSPEQIAEGFLTALKYSDYEGAKKYSSARTADVLDMKSGLAGDEKFGEFEMGSTKLEGEYASVGYLDSKGRKQKIKLGKDSQGNWEVIMTKSDFNDLDK